MYIGAVVGGREEVEADATSGLRTVPIYYIILYYVHTGIIRIYIYTLYCTRIYTVRLVRQRVFKMANLPCDDLSQRTRPNLIVSPKRIRI